MGFGFRAATEKKLGPADASVRLGQISVQRERPARIRRYLRPRGLQGRGRGSVCIVQDRKVDALPPMRVAHVKLQLPKNGS
jgi:hypothetical protein